MGGGALLLLFAVTDQLVPLEVKDDLTWPLRARPAGTARYGYTSDAPVLPLTPGELLAGDWPMSLPAIMFRDQRLRPWTFRYGMQSYDIAQALTPAGTGGLLKVLDEMMFAGGLG